MGTLRTGDIGNLLPLLVVDEGLLLFRRDPPFACITHGVVS